MSESDPSEDILEWVKSFECTADIEFSSISDLTDGRVLLSITREMYGDPTPHSNLYL